MSNWFLEVYGALLESLVGCYVKMLMQLACRCFGLRFFFLRVSKHLVVTFVFGGFRLFLCVLNKVGKAAN